MIEGTALYRLCLVKGLLVDCGRYYAVPRLLQVLSLRFVIVNVCILLYQNVFIDAVVVNKSLTADLILSVYLSDHGNRIQKVAISAELLIPLTSRVIRIFYAFFHSFFWINLLRYQILLLIHKNLKQFI